MRWKFNGGTCCTCTTEVCVQDCACTIGNWFPKVNGPSQFLVSDIVVPSSYRLWSAEYAYPCPDDNCPEFDPSDPSGLGALIDITPHHKIGYKTLGSFVLNSENAEGTAFCGWSADVSGVPLASSKDDCWGLDAIGVGNSLTQICSVSTGSNDSAWLASPVTATMDSGNIPTGIDWGETHGLGNMFSGLRRIELISPFSVCGQPILRLFPAEVWSPLSSRRWESQLGYCPVWNNPATGTAGGVGGFNNTGAVPINLRYWDIDSFQKDAWDSPNLRGFTPYFDIQFGRPAGGPFGPYDLFGQDIHCDIEGPTTLYMNEGVAFEQDSGGGSAGNCDDFSQVAPDAVTHEYTGTEKCGASLNTSSGELCQCWSNIDGGGGCLPFPKSGPQPDPSQFVTNFVFDNNGVTWTQNAPSLWDAVFATEPWITIPCDLGNINLESYGGTDSGRYIRIWDGSQYTTYLMDSCSGDVTGLSLNTAYSFTATFPHGHDCDECVSTVVDFGCCEQADGTVYVAVNSDQCTSGGGTFSGSGSVCPPTGCCAIVGSSDLSDVTEAHCTSEGGTWTQDAECAPVGWCTDSDTGNVTGGVEENDCIAPDTWTATEPPKGCCVDPDFEDVYESQCTAMGGSSWTEGACPEPPLGYCQDPATGIVTSNVLEANCTGTWSETPFPTGCCAFIGSPDQSGVNEVVCTVAGGAWTEGVNCDGTGWCVNNSTGAVTAGVEQNDCSGTWYSTQPSIGCCVIGGTDNPDVEANWCAGQGGTFNSGACAGPVLGWCVDNTTGAIVGNITQGNCTGTWSASEPTSGCCTINGTQNPDVADTWCTAQSGTFVAGACPTPTFDPCGETYTAVLNYLFLDMNDPNFFLANPFYYDSGTWTQGGANNDKDPCSTEGVKLNAGIGLVDIYGDQTDDPSNLSFASHCTAKYNSGSSTWTVEVYMAWTQSGNSWNITATKSGISIPSAGCPTFDVVGSFDTFSGNYTQSGNGTTFTVADLVGDLSITLTCI